MRDTMSNVCLFIVVLLFIKVVLELCLPSNRCVNIFFGYIDNEKYEYDLKKFKMLDITMSLIAAILLLIFYYTHNNLWAVLCFCITIIFIIAIYVSVRKKKVQ